MSGPHDLFARYTFGHPERAAAELRAVLPAHVVSEVDWNLVVVIRYLLWVEEDAAIHTAVRRVLHSVLDRQRAEELMGSWAEEMIERGVQKGLHQGLTQGRAEYILRILTARGVQVSEAARQHILTCTDLATLDRWFDRSLNATTLSEVLDGLAQ